MSTVCRDFMKSFERHIRSSHAIGKFIVDGVVGRVWSMVNLQGKTHEGRATVAEHVDTASPPDSSDAAAGGGLPLAEADFALLTSADVVDLISRSTESEIRAIGEYERSHRRRRLVLEAVSARITQ